MCFALYESNLIATIYRADADNSLVIWVVRDALINSIHVLLADI